MITSFIIWLFSAAITAAGYVLMGMLGIVVAIIAGIIMLVDKLTPHPEREPYTVTLYRDGELVLSPGPNEELGREIIKELTCPAESEMPPEFGRCQELATRIRFGMKKGRKMGATDERIRAWLGGFDPCKIVSIDFSGLDVKQVSDMSGLFKGYTSLVGADLSSLRADSVETMAGMFEDCVSLRTASLPVLDANSNSIDATGIFKGCESLELVSFINREDGKEHTLTSLDVAGAFEGCSSLESVDLGDITCDSEGLAYTFAGCTSLKSVRLDDVNYCRAESFEGAFRGCTSLEYIDLDKLAAPSMTNLSHMFEGCTSLVSVGRPGWDAENVIDMSRMFAGCSSLEELDLSAFVAKDCEDFSGMFAGCRSLRRLDLSGLDTVWAGPEVTGMFDECEVLGDLGVVRMVGRADDVVGEYYASRGVSSAPADSEAVEPNALAATGDWTTW